MKYFSFKLSLHLWLLNLNEDYSKCLFPCRVSFFCLESSLNFTLCSVCTSCCAFVSPSFIEQPLNLFHKNVHAQLLETLDWQTVSIGSVSCVEPRQSVWGERQALRVMRKASVCCCEACRCCTRRRMLCLICLPAVPLPRVSCFLWCLG